MSEGGDSDWESAVEAVSEGVRALKPPSSGRIVAQDGSGLNPPTRSHTRSPADGGARVRSPSPLGEAATSSTNVVGGSFCDPRADAASKAWIDPFLREALEGGGDARMAVLRVDAEVCGFARDDTRTSHEFAGNGYQRMIAHKVAAHHGLTSRSVVGADGQDRALIEKESGVSSSMDPPVVNLADVRGDTDESVKGDNKKKKVTVMKRGGGGRGGGNNGGPGAGHRKSGGSKKPGSMSVEEREAEYTRARERIFGGGGSGEDSGRTSPTDKAEFRTEQGASRAEFRTERREGGRQGGSRQGGRQGQGGGRQGGGHQGGDRQGGGRGGRQAIVRNRMADSMDPDFVRMPSPAAFHPGGGPPPSNGAHHPMTHSGGYYDPSPVGPPQYDGYDPNGVDAYGYRDSYPAPPPHSHSYTDRGYGGGYGDGDGYGDGGGEFPALGVAGGHVPPIWAPPPPPPGAPPPMNQPMRGYDAPPYGSNDRRVDEAPPLRFGNFQQLGSGYRPGPR